MDLGEQGPLLVREEVAEGSEADRQVEDRGEGQGQGVGADQVEAVGWASRARVSMPVLKSTPVIGPAQTARRTPSPAPVPQQTSRPEPKGPRVSSVWVTALRRRSEVRKGVASNLFASRS